MTDAQKQLCAWLAFQGPLVIPMLYMAGVR
jgi:hypothetical protein